MPLTIARRFRGPLTSANGGYTAGLLARELAPDGGGVEVTLRQPPPLETALELVRDGERLELCHAGTLVAEARPSEPGLVAPLAPAFETALAASRRAGGLGVPEFEECFVCGTRPEGDGLEIHAGALESGSGLVAATWVAREPEFPLVWAAIDCPGAYALHGEGRGDPLLARITARLERLPVEGERCVVVGWPIGEDGRKRHAATALYGDGGQPIAVSRQLWIAPAAARGAREEASS